MEPKPALAVCAELDCWPASGDLIRREVLLFPGLVVPAISEAGMTCVHWQLVSAWLCQVHLDSAPALSGVIICPETPL